MYTKLIAYLVCMSITGVTSLPNPVHAGSQTPGAAVSEAELLQKFPGARIIHVTQEDYPELEERLRSRGYVPADAMNTGLASDERQTQTRAHAQAGHSAKSSNECAGEGVDSSGETSINVLLDFTDDLMDAGGKSSRDTAAIVFIIIGAVVLVVWALYVFKYIYDVSVGLTPCGRWREVTALSSSASTGENQHARFNGLRYSTGFRDGITDAGISLEVGQADILLQEAGVLELKGNYFLMGPLLRWRLSQSVNPAAFQLDFTAGTTENDEVGLLARARASLVFGFGDYLRLGLSWGVLNVNLDENQGIITERSQYHYLYGINMGFRF